MTAQDFMIRDIISVSPDTSIRDLLLLFAERKVSGVPVIDRTGHLKGMVTVGDVLRNIQPHFTHALDLLSFVTYYVEQATLPQLFHEMMADPVAFIMTKGHLSSVKEDTPLETVAQMIAHSKFKKLPVLDADAKVVGVISRGDLLRYIVQELLQES